MNLSLKTLCPACETVTMYDHGCSLGGSLTTWNHKCPDCGLVICTFLMKEGFRYRIEIASKEAIEKREKLRAKLYELTKEAEDIRKQLDN